MQQRIKNNIWPMAQLMQGLTSDSLTEKLEMINMLTVRIYIIKPFHIFHL